MNKLILAVPALVVGVVGRIIGQDVLVFVATIVALIPLAGLMGEATEELASHTGPRLGGFLNATFGNAAELIIGIFLIRSGEIEVLKASLAGSVIGNILLILGIALFVGGIRNGIQRFDAQLSGMHTAALAIAVVGLMMPALFHQAVPEAEFIETEGISLGVAIVLLAVYAAVIGFSFFSADDGAPDAHPAHEPTWSMQKSVVGLIVAAALVAVASEALVHSLEEASRTLGLSELFIGLILVPVVGNAAEHFSAVIFAAKDRVNIAIEIAAGSGTQIALFVAPILVVISLVVGQPMDFFFNAFEIAAVGLSTVVLGFIALDGRSNWLEGVLLIASYLIMGISFFFLPGGAA